MDALPAFFLLLLLLELLRLLERVYPSNWARLSRFFKALSAFAFRSAVRRPSALRRARGFRSFWPRFSVVCREVLFLFSKWTCGRQSRNQSRACQVKSHFRGSPDILSSVVRIRVVFPLFSTALFFDKITRNCRGVLEISGALPAHTRGSFRRRSTFIIHGCGTEGYAVGGT